MNAQLKVLIADSDNDFCQLLKSFLAKNGPFNPIFMVNDGQSMINTAIKERPDAIICDLALPKIDGLSALKEIFANTPGPQPTTFLLSAFSSEYSMQIARELGLDQIIMKPCHFGTLAGHLKSCCAKKSNYQFRLPKISQTHASAYVSNLLGILKTPTHLKGYRYLYDAIVMCICQAPTAGVTKTIYPAIGTLHGVSSYCVERSIRAAVTVTWELGGTCVFSDLLPSLRPNKKPSNWQLISACAIAFEQKELQL